MCGECLITQQQAEQQHSIFNISLHYFPLSSIKRFLQALTVQIAAERGLGNSRSAVFSDEFGLQLWFSRVGSLPCSEEIEGWGIKQPSTAKNPKAGFTAPRSSRLFV
jgi:hypothetical protein